MEIVEELHCRVCLVSDIKLSYHSLLEEPIRTAFLDCTSIEISASDGISTDICSTCVAQCQSAKYFRDLAIENDQKLRELLQDTDNIVCERLESECDAEDEIQDPMIVQILPESYLTIEEEDEVEEDIVVPESDVDETKEDAHHETSTPTELEMEEDILVYEEDAGESSPISISFAEPPAAKNAVKKALASTAKKPNVTRSKKTKNELSCPLCFSIFSTRRALSKHFGAIHPGQIYFCASCSESFNSPSVWYSHNCTDKNREFCCEVCGKSYNNRGALLSHMYCHNESLYECPNCPKTFNHPAHFKKHLARHTDERNIACDLCDKTFKENRDVVRHKQIVHMNQRPHQCERCPRSFVFRYQLTRHMQSHTGIRTHPCTVCSKVLSSSNALRHHMYVHTGEKPYACTICPAVFRINNNLYKHMKEHEAGQEPQDEESNDVSL